MCKYIQYQKYMFPNFSHIWESTFYLSNNILFYYSRHIFYRIVYVGLSSPEGPHILLEIRNLTIMWCS